MAHLLNRGTITLAILTAVAAFLRFSTLGTQSYWYDEAVTVDLVRRSFNGMLAAIPHSESTPPLYYAFAWGWSRLFGTGEAGLRSLSALFGTATVPAAYAAASAFVSRRSALVTAALVAVSPFLIWFSQEARSYALLVFLSTLSLLYFRRTADRGGRQPSVRWAISSSLAIAAHYFAIFLVAAEAAWLLQRSARLPARDRRTVRRAVGVVALLTAALAPLALYQTRNYAHTSWIPNSGSLGGRLAYLVHQLVVGAYPAANIRPIIAAVPVIVAVGLFAWTEWRDREGALVALALGLITVGAPFALAFVSDVFFAGRGDFFIYRNLIVATVPLTIAAAAVVGTRRAGEAGIVGCVLVCLLLTTLSIDISRRLDLQRPDVRGIATVLGSSPTARAIVLDVRTSLPLKLYLPGLRDVAQRGVRVDEIDLIQQQGGSAALPFLPLGFRRIETIHIQTFTIVRLQAPRPRLAMRSTLVHELPSSYQVAILVDGERPRGSQAAEGGLR